MTEIKKKGRKLGIIRPDLWKSGPDPFKHRYYKAFCQQRNQAQFRDEKWELTFDQWFEAWGDLIDKRGRSIGSYIMRRVDKKLSWSIDNIKLYYYQGE